MTLRDLHQQAMILAQQATVAKYEGNREQFLELTERAFELEKQAALMLKDDYENPTRAILFESAASLADDMDFHEEAKQMRDFIKEITK